MRWSRSGHAGRDASNVQPSRKSAIQAPTNGLTARPMKWADWGRRSRDHTVKRLPAGEHHARGSANGNQLTVAMSGTTSERARSKSERLGNCGAPRGPGSRPCANSVSSPRDPAWLSLARHPVCPRLPTPVTSARSRGIPGVRGTSSVRQRGGHPSAWTAGRSVQRGEATADCWGARAPSPSWRRPPSEPTKYSRAPLGACRDAFPRATGPPKPRRAHRRSPAAPHPDTM